VADYKEYVSKNAKFELVHISLEDEGAHEAWAKEANLPWLAINGEKAGAEIGAMGGGGVPAYVLVDLKGNVITKDKDAVFAKLKGE